MDSEANETMGHLLRQALVTGDNAALEAYLIAHDNGLEFADLIGQIVTQPEPPVEQLEHLLDGWAAREDGASEVLTIAAIMSYRRVAIVRPDWWQDEITKLHRAAADPRSGVREAVFTAVSDLFLADPRRAQAELSMWLNDADPFVMNIAKRLLD
jgi:hypothetical protein